MIVFRHAVISRKNTTVATKSTETKKGMIIPWGEEKYVRKDSFLFSAPIEQFIDCIKCFLSGNMSHTKTVIVICAPVQL